MKNGAGFDPLIENVPIDLDEESSTTICNNCGEDMVEKLINDELYFICTECK